MGAGYRSPGGCRPGDRNASDKLVYVSKPRGSGGDAPEGVRPRARDSRSGHLSPGQPSYRKRRARRWATDAIDFEHAIEVDPECLRYDLSGPSECVPLPPAHAGWGGVLGTYGISWDGPLDERWSGRYVPLGMIFGPVSPGQPN